MAKKHSAVQCGDASPFPILSCKMRPDLDSVTRSVIDIKKCTEAVDSPHIVMLVLLHKMDARQTG